MLWTSQLPPTWTASLVELHSSSPSTRFGSVHKRFPYLSHLAVNIRLGIQHSHFTVESVFHCLRAFPCLHSRSLVIVSFCRSPLRIAVHCSHNRLFLSVCALIPFVHSSWVCYFPLSSTVFSLSKRPSCALTFSPSYCWQSSLIMSQLLSCDTRSTQSGKLGCYPSEKWLLIPSRHRHYGRSFNDSIIAAVSSQPAESTSTQSISLSQTSTQSSPITSVLPTDLSKQVGSVPAEGSGPDAAKIDQQSLMQSSSITTMETPRSSAPASTRTKQVGSVPVEGSGPKAAKIDPQSLAQAQGLGTNAETLHIESDSPEKSPAFSTFQISSSATPTSDASNGKGSPSAPLPGSQFVQSSSAAKTSFNQPATTFATRLSLGTGVATPASQPQTSQIPSAPASSQLSVASGGEVTTSTPTASSTMKVAGPSLSVIPPASGNLAMAVAFNKGYKSLTVDSQCDAKDRLQTTVCIDGLFASCNDAGRYTVSPCPEGKQCFALPMMTGGSTGINVMCESPSNAIRILQAEGTARSSPTIGSTATAKVSSNPTTSALSATAMSSSSATSADQSPDTQGTKTSSAQPNLQTSTTSSNIEPSVYAGTDATTEPSVTPTSFQTPTTSSVVQSSSATFSDAPTPSTTPSPTTKSSFAAPASSSTDVPLIISFPSSLSSEQSEKAPEPTKKVLFPAPAAAAPTSVGVAGKLVEALPAQQDPASVPASAASTVPIAPAGITALPIANDNKKLQEKTVTVTVTATQRL